MVIPQLLPCSYVVGGRRQTPCSCRLSDRERKAYAHHLWSRKGPLVIDSLGPDDTFSTTYFRDVIIAKLVQALIRKRPFRGDEIFHYIWTMLALAVLQA
jgi:hypothetical protein